MTRKRPAQIERTCAAILALLCAACGAPTPEHAPPDGPAFAPARTSLTEQMLPGPGLLSLSGDGTTAVVLVRDPEVPVGDGPRPEELVLVSLRFIDGGWSHVDVYRAPADQTVGEATPAINQDGTVAAFWMCERAEGQWCVHHVIDLSGDGRFLQATPLATPGVAFWDARGALAVSDGGDVVLATHESHVLSGEQSIGAGIAVVYVKSGGVWSPGEVVPSGTSSDRDNFGIRASMNGPGNVFAVAAQGFSDDDVGSSPFVVIFAREAAQLLEQQRLPLAEGIGGVVPAVALSDDGSVLAVGLSHSFADEPGREGEVLLFAQTDGTFALADRLVGPSAMAQDEFGHDVALSADGDSLVVSALGVEKLYVFMREGGVWTFAQRLRQGNDARFGSSLALSANGHVLAAGANFRPHFYQLGAPANGL